MKFIESIKVTAMVTVLFSLCFLLPLFMQQEKSAEEILQLDSSIRFKFQPFRLITVKPPEGMEIESLQPAEDFGGAKCLLGSVSSEGVTRNCVWNEDGSFRFLSNDLKFQDDENEFFKLNGLFELPADCEVVEFSDTELDSNQDAFVVLKVKFEDGREASGKWSFKGQMLEPFVF